jgi:type II secretory pathway pseudopilin PulG
MKHLGEDNSGVTLVELVISMVVITFIMLGIFGLFVSMVRSATVAKSQAVASTLATNQMEYLKSLPFDSLAVAGGSIYSTSPLPATSVQKVDGVSYTVKTNVNYVDDAYDGCGSYPTLALKQQYCRNYPAPSGAPSVDTNPRDYKVVHVAVTDKSGLNLADVDTDVSAKVSETASTTGAMFVSVIDDNGNPVTGATVQVKNSTVTPAVDLSDNTDENGIAILYGLPVDSGYDYQVIGSKTGYSTLTTIPPSGSLQPTYSSQKILSQASSYVALTIKPQGANSLVIETTDTNGAALANAKIYVKGGYKKYSATTDTQYYYDTLSPTDTRPVTDAGGLAGLSNLVPGSYLFCGDAGATSCSGGGTTYYLAAAVPYGGTNALNPIIVPTYDPASPPATTFSYGATSYLQKVRLMLTTVSNFPRVLTLTPSDASVGTDNLSSYAFTITGANLPCSAVASSCSTTVSFKQASSNFAASCTGASAGVLLHCTVNLSSVAQGGTQLVVTANGKTLTLPAAPLLGGINVGP